MRIGCIYTAFNTREYLTDSLAPFLAAREQRLGGHTWVLCAVNVAFAGFPIETEDGTRRALAEMHNDGTLDNLIAGPDNIPETVARGMALTWLKGEGCDTIWMADSDEFPTLHHLSQIVEFVTDNPWVAWFKLSLKNYVFDTNTYLIEPFTPPRIFRVAASALDATHFSADNDISYGGIPCHVLASLTIPAQVAWIPHFSWLSDDRAHRKIAYQMARWGDACSFRWDLNKGLVFNPALPTPKTAVDNPPQS